LAVELSTGLWASAVTVTSVHKQVRLRAVDFNVIDGILGSKCRY
jgi:hypothetical protein